MTGAKRCGEPNSNLRTWLPACQQRRDKTPFATRILGDPEKIGIGDELLALNLSRRYQFEVP